MNNHLSIALFVTLAVLSCPTLAHEPNMHEQKDATAPDCSSLKDTDASKMDMNDSPTKALHDQCKNAMSHGHLHGQDMDPDPSSESGGQ